MLPPVPLLDVAGYKRRTKVAPSDVDGVVAQYPGYIEHRIARGSSWISARLGKRYRVPLGQDPPAFVATGSAPPPIALSGRPVLGSLELVFQVLTAGALGAATFWWSVDGGQAWTMAPALASAGTTPPAVTVVGAAELSSPAALGVQVTTAGALGTARVQWSADGGATWNVGSAMASTGTSPPAVALSGTSNVALPSDVQIQITTAGPLGTALFQWSQDGGATWTTGLQTSGAGVPLGFTGLTATFSLGLYATNNAYVGQGQLARPSFVLGSTGLTLGFPAGAYAADNVYTGQGLATAASFVVPGTGLTATFPGNAGNYSADNVYSAPTPAPEIALGWLVAMLDVDVWTRRGTNYSDPAIAEAVAQRTEALGEIKEAADSKEGLFELPLNDQEQGGAGVVRSAPVAYTESSPFVAADVQESLGRAEDLAGVGGTFSYPGALPLVQPGQGENNR